ncbi:MAG: hypothetical protein Q7R65_02265 [bacterium]|nr:hypothetical protein [bacterium]
MKEITKIALFNAVGTTAYIVAIANFLFYVPKKYFGPTDTVLVPIVMLLIFVFSASITGALIFGRPIMWFLEGKKQEALSLLASTLIIFLVITVVILFIFFLSLR